MRLSTFKNKKVLITGHTGFKGSWLSTWLSQLGANVIGISNSVPSNPSHYQYIKKSLTHDHREDIRNFKGLSIILKNHNPDFVFHLAAQPLVRESYKDPLSTWNTNLIGTLNLLEALREMQSPCYAVFITSDKCYDNLEWTWGYRENDRLGGPDPYSASKGCAELAINSYKKSFFNSSKSIVRIASARAGNVIGGGDWAKDRIVPDCMRAWSISKSVKLRNPNSTRPWQHVLEPLSGYLALALALYSNNSIHGESFNFGPQSAQTHSVLDVVKEMAKYWDKVKWIEDSIDKNNLYESCLLKLNCDKALHSLNWYSCLSFHETVKLTVDWYKSFKDNPMEIEKLSNKQIKEYINLASERGVGWAK